MRSQRRGSVLLLPAAGRAAGSDISRAAIGHPRARLGSRAAAVRWLSEDLLTWDPGRSWRVWHDRAAYHFLTTAAEQGRYRQVLDAATGPAAVAVLGCFAPDEPGRCSGLPVARYSATDLAGHLNGWALISQAREEHATPAGVMRPFTWVALRKQS
ncbi:MAG: hypothetical protein ACRDNZ_13460 [Streptosporangiaceae bacterium]